METFLLGDNIFSVDNLINQHTSLKKQVLIVIGSLALMVIAGFILRFLNFEMHQIIILGLIGIIVLIGKLYTDSSSYTVGFPRQFSQKCEFNYSQDSNLILKQDPKFKPKSIKDTRAYPYRLYIHDPKHKHQIIYLGTVHKHKLNTEKATSDTAKTFAKYNQYIVTNHLESEFVHRIELKYTLNKQSYDHVVLQGDDIALGLKTVKNKEVVYEIPVNKE